MPTRFYTNEFDKCVSSYDSISFCFDSLSAATFLRQIGLLSFSVASILYFWKKKKNCQFWCREGKMRAEMKYEHKLAQRDERRISGRDLDGSRRMKTSVSCAPVSEVSVCITRHLKQQPPPPCTGGNRPICAAVRYGLKKREIFSFSCSLLYIHAHELKQSLLTLHICARK